MPGRTLNYDFATAGEKLVFYLDSQILNSIPWGIIEKHLLRTGRSIELCHFFREVTCVGVASRLIVAGNSLIHENAIQSNAPQDDPILQRKLKEYVEDRLLILGAERERLMRLLTEALRQSRRSRTPDVVKQDLLEFAKNSHRHCYLCGGRLDFNTTGQPDSYTREHVWPKAWGGDSEIDNLLPACKKCNDEKKNRQTWVMSDIQALLLQFSPFPSLQSLKGSHSFSLHCYAARKLAARKRTTLKQAYLRLGPWTDVRLKDENEVADFFNLENHAPHLDL